MRFDLGAAVVTVAATAGPRILGYAGPSGRQLFADLPDAVIRHPAVGTYRFLGGHRLWRAPEVPAVTYADDEHGATVRSTDEGLELVGAPDGDGVVKTIRIVQRGRATIVDHELLNRGVSAVRLAPWAITQFAPGGTALLPQPAVPVDQDGALPNRSFVLWPYTDLADPVFAFSAGLLLVDGSHRPTRSKIGWPNRRGWLGYAAAGELFVKWARRHDDDADYADMGASAQCYRDERFVELETLGPLVELEPGGVTTHREVWTVVDVGGHSLAELAASLPAEPEEMGR